MMKARVHICLLAAILPLLFFSCKKDGESGNGGNGDGNGEAENFTVRYNKDQKFYSKILGEEIRYSVLLPQEYLTNDSERYPVVYLFHGWGEDQNAWGPSGLNIQQTADRCSSSGTSSPMIFVMPQGFNTYFCNKYDGSYNYMDMLIEELVPLIDTRFRTKADKSYRATAGYSMGGFGAISVASRNPSTFSVAVGLSPSLNTDEQYTTLPQYGWDIQWGSNFGGVGQYGNGRLTSYYKSQCPLHFFAENPASDFASVHYFIDCGDDEERLYMGNGELHSVMRKRGIDHEYRVRNGAHTSSYWTSGMPEALHFIQKSFDGETYPDTSTDRMTSSAHSTPETITVSGIDVELRLPSDYNPSDSYGILYYGRGNGGTDLTVEDVAMALDSLINVRKLVIAGFSSAEAAAKNIEFDAIAGAVEAEVSTSADKESRIALTYGDNADYLYSCTTGSDPKICSIFMEDSEVSDLSGLCSADEYYLDMTDGGTNYAGMLEIFETLRNASANVNYRVRNGTDDKASAKNGIYSMSDNIGSHFKRK